MNEFEVEIGTEEDQKSGTDLSEFKMCMAI